ncbi:Sre G protein-coupled chemoreceptor [Cooperia oncophora]
MIRLMKSELLASVPSPKSLKTDCHGDEIERFRYVKEVASLILYYPNVLARAIIFLYEISILKAEGNLFFIAIVGAGIVRLWFANVVALYLPSAIVERFFASKYITDYERISRPWIHRVIIMCVYLSALNGAVYSVLGLLSVVTLAVSSATFLILSCLAYVTLFRREYVRLRYLNQDVHPESVCYTLSTKYQLTENLRVLKILMILSIVLAVGATITCSLFTLSTKVVMGYPHWRQMCYGLIDITFAVWLDVIILIFMVFLGVIDLETFPQFSKTKAAMLDRTINDHRGAATAYFEQLSRTWNRPTRST